jgi:hypothetical protein
MSVAVFGAPLTQQQESDVDAVLVELSGLKPNKKPAAKEIVRKKKQFLELVARVRRYRRSRSAEFQRD